MCELFFLTNRSSLYTHFLSLRKAKITHRFWAFAQFIRAMCPALAIPNPSARGENWKDPHPNERVAISGYIPKPSAWGEIWIINLIIVPNNTRRQPMKWVSVICVVHSTKKPYRIKVNTTTNLTQAYSLPKPVKCYVLNGSMFINKITESIPCSGNFSRTPRRSASESAPRKNR